MIIFNSCLFFWFLLCWVNCVNLDVFFFFFVFNLFYSLRFVFLLSFLLFLGFGFGFVFDNYYIRYLLHIKTDDTVIFIIKFHTVYFSHLLSPLLYSLYLFVIFAVLPYPWYIFNSWRVRETHLTLFSSTYPIRMRSFHEKSKQWKNPKMKKTKTKL